MSLPSPNRQSLLMTGLCAVLLAPLALADEILVITDSLHPVHVPPEARVIELDRPHYIKAKLSSNLPSAPDQSIPLVQQRLKTGGTPLQQQLLLAYQDVVDAWALGITNIPAVVVDRRYVVYGEPDAIKAVALIEAYRRNQP